MATAIRIKNSVSFITDLSSLMTLPPSGGFSIHPECSSFRVLLCQMKVKECQRLSSIHEPVSFSVDGEDMPGPGRVFLDFLSQLQDVVVNRPGRGELVVSPDLVEERLPGDHFAFGGDEEFQDIDFKGRQVEFMARAPHFEMDEIDLDVPESEGLGNGPRLHFLAAQMGLGPRHGLLAAERLGDVMVGSGFE